jgi:hypothetical protein
MAANKFLAFIFTEMNYLMSCCQVDDVDAVECAAKSSTWATMNESVSLDDKLTLAAVVVMMLVDAVLYMAVALVMEKMQHSGQSFGAFLVVSIVFLLLSLNVMSLD